MSYGIANINFKIFRKCFCMQGLRRNIFCCPMLSYVCPMFFYVNMGQLSLLFVRIYSCFLSLSYVSYVRKVVRPTGFRSKM